MGKALFFAHNLFEYNLGTSYIPREPKGVISMPRSKSAFRCGPQNQTETCLCHSEINF